MPCHPSTSGRRWQEFRLGVYPDLPSVPATDCTLSNGVYSEGRRHLTPRPRCSSHRRGLLHVGMCGTNEPQLHPVSPADNGTKTRTTQPASALMHWQCQSRPYYIQGIVLAGKGGEAKVSVASMVRWRPRVRRPHRPIHPGSPLSSSP